VCDLGCGIIEGRYSTHRKLYIGPIEGIIVNNDNLLTGELYKCPQPIMRDLGNPVIIECALVFLKGLE
jgi:hypothetical protein